MTHLLTGISGTRAWLCQVGIYNPLVVALGTAVVCWVDFVGGGHRIQQLLNQPTWVRWPAYYALAAAILLLAAEAPSTFIYFQF